MRSDRRILLAFLLNLLFSVVEFVGGVLTGSTAIASDAVHDLGDSISIGVSFILETISKRKPNDWYTYGYRRYSVLGGLLTTVILLIGSLLVLIGAIARLVNPIPIHYNGMIAVSVFGALINVLAAFLTRSGASVNQKAVNLHMLEDALGWIVVLAGAVIMKFVEVPFLDPLLSIGVSVFIFVEALKNGKVMLDIFLEKTPQGLSVEDIKSCLFRLEGVLDVHHVHVHSLDGVNHVATLHVVTEKEPQAVKETVREALWEHGICHTTIEMETSDEDCHALHCDLHEREACHACGHHHHHHG